MNRLILALILGMFGLPAHAVETGHATSQIDMTPNSSAYSNGQCLGGVFAVPGMIRPGGPGGTEIQGAAISDSSATNASIDIFLFNASPTGNYVDHTNCNIATPDQPSLVGMIPFTSFSCIKDQSAAMGLCQSNQIVPITAGTLPATSSAIYAVPVIRAGPTYGSGKKVYFNFKAKAD